MTKILLLAVSAVLATTAALRAGAPDLPRNMGAPDFSRLPADIAGTLRTEGVNAEIYEKINMRQVVTVKRPTPKDKSGIHYTTYIMVASSVQNAWASIVDCNEKLKFVVHLSGCVPVMPPSQPPSETVNGMALKFLEYSKQEVKFSFTTVSMTLGIWINKPNIYFFKQIQGGLRLNEGYWRIIPLSPKLLVINYRTITDIGKIVPDFIGKSLTEKDLPDRVRLTRKYIEEVLEKRR